MEKPTNMDDLKPTNMDDLGGFPPIFGNTHTISIY